MPSSWQYVLYGMEFKTDLEHARSAWPQMDEARREFAMIRQVAGRALQDLPDHRALVEQLCREHAQRQQATRGEAVASGDCNVTGKPPSPVRAYQPAGVSPSGFCANQSTSSGILRSKPAGVLMHRKLHSVSPRFSKSCGVPPGIST